MSLFNNTDGQQTSKLYVMTDIKNVPVMILVGSVMLHMYVHRYMCIS